MEDSPPRMGVGAYGSMAVSVWAVLCKNKMVDDLAHKGIVSGPGLDKVQWTITVDDLAQSCLRRHSHTPIHGFHLWLTYCD